MLKAVDNNIEKKVPSRMALTKYPSHSTSLAPSTTPEKKDGFLSTGTPADRQPSPRRASQGSSSAGNVPNLITVTPPTPGRKER